MILNENRRVVTNSNINPPRKKKSAILSNNSDCLLFFLIERKERMQLVINKMMAHTVTSSTIVFSDLFNIFSEVKTIKQMPSRFDDAFRM